MSDKKEASNTYVYGNKPKWYTGTWKTKEPRYMITITDRTTKRTVLQVGLINAQIEIEGSVSPDSDQYCSSGGGTLDLGRYRDISISGLVFLEIVGDFK